MPMRWEAQRIGDDVADDDAIPGLDVVSRIPGLVRSVTTAEFAGITFHEVLAKSVLNAVPAASAMPFRFTVNAFRGCSHACAYCYARGSHTWLDLGPGDDFDRQVVVKTNAAQVLDRELGRPAWDRQHVALGTNTDPYQRAEGRYTLMPGIIDALVRHRTPLSILTKGTLLRRDLPQLSEAAGTVPVGIGVSIAVLDEQVRASLEPGTPSARARLELVRAVRDAGLPCGVFMAPVLPGITDGLAALDDALARVAEAGATGVTVLPLHLRPGAREVYLGWLARERPDLVERYRRMYARGAPMCPRSTAGGYAAASTRCWSGTASPGSAPVACEASLATTRVRSRLAACPRVGGQQVGGPRVCQPVRAGRLGDDMTTTCSRRCRSRDGASARAAGGSRGQGAKAGSARTSSMCRTPPRSASCTAASAVRSPSARASSADSASSSRTTSQPRRSERTVTASSAS